MSDTTTTELERLRADLEVLDRYGLSGYAWTVKKKIARLEADQADPWRDVHEHFRIAKSGNGFSSISYKRITEYFDHLTAENERLAARVAELERNYDLANSTIKTATERLNEEKAEKERLAARVAELEAEPEFTPVVLKRADEISVGDVILAGERIRTVTDIDSSHKTHRIIKCDGLMERFYHSDLVAVLPQPLVEAKTLADMQPPFEGPIVGLEPILDPARVLATAAEVVDLLNMDGIGYLIRHQMRHLNPKAYPVRKNPDGSPQFQRKGAENGG